MPEKSYRLNFVFRDGKLDTGEEYNDLPTALSAFRCLVDPNTAAIYSGVTLMEYDWANRTERIVAALAL